VEHRLRGLTIALNMTSEESSLLSSLALPNPKSEISFNHYDLRV
jgi:hypothetical protein